MPGREPTSAELLALKKAGDSVVPFGRFKGQTLRDVDVENRPYLEWMERNCNLRDPFASNLTLWLDYGHRETE